MMAVLLGTIWPASGGLLASTAERLSQDAGLCFVFFSPIFFQARSLEKSYLLTGIIQVCQ